MSKIPLGERWQRQSQGHMGTLQVASSRFGKGGETGGAESSTEWLRAGLCRKTRSPQRKFPTGCEDPWRPRQRLLQGKSRRAAPHPDKASPLCRTPVTLITPRHCTHRKQALSCLPQHPYVKHTHILITTLLQWWYVSSFSLTTHTIIRWLIRNSVRIIYWPFSRCCLFLLNSVDCSKFSYVYYFRICHLCVLCFTQFGMYVL